MVTAGVVEAVVVSRFTPSSPNLSGVRQDETGATCWKSLTNDDRLSRFRFGATSLPLRLA